jgi:hypothetical protein
MPLAAAELGAKNAFRAQERPPMAKRRKSRDVGWWSAAERLEYPNVEDVVDAGAVGELQPVGHRVHLFGDQIRTCKLRPKLAATSWDQFLRGRV